MCYEGRRLKLGDFGVARETKVSGTFAMTLIGTVQYAAPEVLQGHGYKSYLLLYGVVILDSAVLYFRFKNNTIIR